MNNNPRLKKQFYFFNPGSIVKISPDNCTVEIIDGSKTYYGKNDNEMKKYVGGKRIGKFKR